MSNNSCKKCQVAARVLRLAALMASINLTHLFKIAAAEYTFTCKSNTDCYSTSAPGYVCQSGRCVCDSDKDTSLFSSPCNQGQGVHGNHCRSDADCKDFNLMCAKMDKTCKCRRGFVWDVLSRRCYKLGDDEYGPSKIGTVSDLVSTLIFVLGVGALMYLMIKLFCNCSKLWRRNSAPRADVARIDGDQQCIQMNNAQGAWVASYRVIGSLEHSPSSQFSGRNAAVPPYLLLPAMGAAPPPYEEALKHKVILSSYPSPVPAAPQTPSSATGGAAADPLEVGAAVDAEAPPPPHSASSS